MGSLSEWSQHRYCLSQRNKCLWRGWPFLPSWEEKAKPGNSPGALCFGYTSYQQADRKHGLTKRQAEAKAKADSASELLTLKERKLCANCFTIQLKASGGFTLKEYCQPHPWALCFPPTFSYPALLFCLNFTSPVTSNGNSLTINEALCALKIFLLALNQ